MRQFARDRLRDRQEPYNDDLPHSQLHENSGSAFEQRFGRCAIACAIVRSACDILVRRFRYVGKTIALILAFVGIKILAADLVRVSDLGSLAVIAALLAGGVVASLAADRLDPPHPAEGATRRPPRYPKEPTARRLRRSAAERKMEA